MNIKGLIFDLDGTLALSQQYHVQAFAEVFKRHGLTYTAEDDGRYAGKGSHCTFPEFFAEHGMKITPEQVEQYSKEKKEIYDRLIADATIQLVPGEKNFLENMKSRGMKMIVATGNKIDAAKLILSKIGILEFFQEIVTNSEVKHSKPFPDIFLKAAEKIGLKPEECVVFEDAVNGVQAAKSGHIRCIALLTTTPEKILADAGADHIVHNYDEVADKFLQ